MSSGDHFDGRGAPRGPQHGCEKEADDESSHVRPPGYTTLSGRLNVEHRESRDELNQKPVAKKEYCRHFDFPKNDEKRNQRGDAGAREGKEVSSEDAGD